MSEQPIVIGRGLMATTAALVVMIALAVLWTMLPTRAGRTAVVSVRSTLATGSLTDTDPTASQPSAPNLSTLAPTTAAPATAVATTAPPPMPTYDVQKTTTLDDGAVAVAVSGSSLVITTAYAVSGDEAVELRLTDGSTEFAQVLFVDQASGLAVLATHSASDVVAFDVAEMAPGDELTLAGDADVKYTVGPDGELEEVFEYDAIREGTPLMNQHGDLVALCSRAGGGRFVTIGDIDGLQRALAGWSGKIWMGIVFETNDVGQLVIDAVDPGGPAALAGFQNGDIIVAINGGIVADSAAFVEALAGLLPGDSVQITVRNLTGAEVTLVLQLGIQ